MCGEKEAAEPGCLRRVEEEEATEPPGAAARRPLVQDTSQPLTRCSLVSMRELKDPTGGSAFVMVAP